MIGTEEGEGVGEWVGREAAPGSQANTTQTASIGNVILLSIIKRFTFCSKVSLPCEGTATEKLPRSSQRAFAELKTIPRIQLC